MNDPARVPLSKAEQDALVLANIGLVRHYAHQAHGALDFDDRVSEGMLGLIRAAADFDANRGAAFGTYASWWIKAFIFAAVARHQGSTRNTKTAKIYTHLRKVIHEAEGAGIEPSNEYVAKRLDVTVEALAAIRAHVLFGMVRLDQLDTGGDHSVGHADHWLSVYGLVTRETPEHHAIAHNEQVTAAAMIRIAMRGMSRREREVIGRRYLDDEGETLQAIADDWGLSRERIRQIELKAMGKLKRGLERLRKVVK